MPPKKKNTKKKTSMPSTPKLENGDLDPLSVVTPADESNPDFSTPNTPNEPSEPAKTNGLFGGSMLSGFKSFANQAQAALTGEPQSTLTSEPEAMDEKKEEGETNGVAPEGEVSLADEKQAEPVHAEGLNGTEKDPLDVAEESQSKDVIDEKDVKPEDVEEKDITPEVIDEKDAKIENVEEKSIKPEDASETPVKPEDVDETPVKPEDDGLKPDERDALKQMEEMNKHIRSPPADENVNSLADIPEPVATFSHDETEVKSELVEPSVVEDPGREAAPRGDGPLADEIVPAVITGEEVSPPLHTAHELASGTDTITGKAIEPEAPPYVEGDAVAEAAVADTATTVEEAIAEPVEIDGSAVPADDVVVSEKEIEPTTVEPEKEVEPTTIEPEKEIEPTEPITEKEIEPTEPITEKEIEPTEPITEKEIEPAESINEKEIEPIEPVTEKEIDPVTTEPVTEKDGEATTEPVTTDELVEAPSGIVEPPLTPVPQYQHTPVATPTAPTLKSLISRDPNFSASRYLSTNSTTFTSRPHHVVDIGHDIDSRNMDSSLKNWYDKLYSMTEQLQFKDGWHVLEEFDMLIQSTDDAFNQISMVHAEELFARKPRAEPSDEEGEIVEEDLVERKRYDTFWEWKSRVALAGLCANFAAREVFGRPLFGVDDKAIKALGSAMFVFAKDLDDEVTATEFRHMTTKLLFGSKSYQKSALKYIKPLATELSNILSPLNSLLAHPTTTTTQIVDEASTKNQEKPTLETLITSLVLKPTTILHNTIQKDSIYFALFHPIPHGEFIPDMMEEITVDGKPTGNGAVAFVAQPGLLRLGFPKYGESHDIGVVSKAKVIREGGLEYN